MKAILSKYNIAEFSQKILKNKFTHAILIYIILVTALLLLRDNEIASKIGFYLISIPAWIVFLLLLMSAYIFFWKALKYVIYGSVTTGFLILLSGLSINSITTLTPLKLILSFFMFFVTLLAFTLLGLGFIGALLLGGVATRLSQSPEVAGCAAILGFLAALLATWQIYTRMIVPFSFGFSSSIISAYLSTTIAGTIFHQNFENVFILSFSQLESCFSGGNIWIGIDLLIKHMVFPQLAIQSPFSQLHIQNW